MIFISHSTQDDLFVNRLRNVLRKHGYETWVDHSDVLPGKIWDQVVEEVLGTVDLMILILSNSAIKSHAVAAEWREFLNLNKTIIPVRIEECRPPMLIRHLQYIDFFGASTFDDHVQKLLKVLPAPTHPVNTEEIEVDEKAFELARLKAQADGLSIMMKGLIQDNQAVFVLPDFTEKLIVDMTKGKVFIGWYDQETGAKPDLDLSKYEAMKHGVSRQHAMLTKTSIGFTLTDLSSRNGTYIDREHLPVEQPVLLKNKSIVHLGNLTLIVFFKD